jgi:hypothetical protein
MEPDGGKLAFDPLSPRGESVARGAKPLGRGGYNLKQGANSANIPTLSPATPSATPLPRQGGGSENLNQRLRLRQPLVELL